MPIRIVQRPASMLTDKRVLAAFWARVDKNGSVPALCPELGPCWLWTLKPANGRAVFDHGVKGAARLVGAHRFALALKLGRWPEQLACHACDVPMCVNPSHLWEGSNADNMNDAKQKGRLAGGGFYSRGANLDRSQWPERLRKTVESVEGLRPRESTGGGWRGHWLAIVRAREASRRAARQRVVGA